MQHLLVTLLDFLLRWFFLVFSEYCDLIFFNASDFILNPSSEPIIFVLRIPPSACDNPLSIPPPPHPLCLVGQEAEQLRRTVRSLASGPEPGCVARRGDDCVSTCWPLRFLTGDLLNGQ